MKKEEILELENCLDVLKKDGYITRGAQLQKIIEKQWYILNNEIAFDTKKECKCPYWCLSRGGCDNMICLESMDGLECRLCMIKMKT